MLSARLPNASFSQSLPTLQLFWDSVSLGELKTCPRKYQLAIVEGWEPKGQRNVHLEFGIWMHSGREHYYHARAKGSEHEDALLSALHFVLSGTWNKVLKRPWASDDPNKNRFTLIRSLCWYLDQWQSDPMQTLILADGSPAVELSFRYDTGLRTSSTGEPIMLCGHLDRVGQLAGQNWLSDLKTTKHTIKGFSSAEYFAQFSPDNQMSLYDLAGKVVYSLPVAGLMVDAVQVAATFSRFHRSPISRNDAQREEWFRAFEVYVRAAEGYAQADFWPMNDKACFRCHFRPICSRPPGARQMWLESDFMRRVWDPSTPRGNAD